MAKYIVQKESLETVADSIRAKAGISEKLVFPNGWKAAVDGIKGGGSGYVGVLAETTIACTAVITEVS
jgi:hypothetical protein